MQLETDRLIVRYWQEKDMGDLVEGLNNFTVSKWLAVVPFPYLEMHAMQWLQYCLKNNAENNKNSYEFCIELKASRKVIGGLSVSSISKLNGTSGGGIWINEKFHGKGYGREAFAEKIRFSFEDLGLRRLENGFFEGNESSRLLQEKFGYKTEGIRRKKFLCLADGQLKDEVITSLLKEEWIK